MTARFACSYWYYWKLYSLRNITSFVIFYFFCYAAWADVQKCDDRTLFQLSFRRRFLCIRDDPIENLRKSLSPTAFSSKQVHFHNFFTHSPRRAIQVFQGFWARVYASGKQTLFGCECHHSRAASFISPSNFIDVTRIAPMKLCWTTEHHENYGVLIHGRYPYRLPYSSMLRCGFHSRGPQSLQWTPASLFGGPVPVEKILSFHKSA